MSLYNNKNLKPMLLNEIKSVFNNEDCLYEIKFDGIRAIIYVDPNEIIIKSRNGVVLNKLYPELLNIKNIVEKKCIFDGEIVLMEDGVPTFSKLLSRNRLKDKIKIEYFSRNNPVSFVCFDILYEDRSLIDLSLVDRKKILNKYEDNDYFIKSRVYSDGIKLFRLVKKMNLEGVVIKKKCSKYIPGIRSNDWIKVKYIKDDIFYICGYLEKENVLSLLLGKKVSKKFIYVSKVIIGKKREECSLIKSCKVIDNYLDNFNDLKYFYIEPIYQCVVTYLEQSKNGGLRHSIFKNLIK